MSQTMKRARFIVTLMVFLLSSVQSFGFTRVNNVTAFAGVDPTGGMDSATGINAVASIGKLYFPCGTYLIASVVNLPSNTDIEGAGECAVIKVSRAMVANPNQFPGASGVKNAFANADYKLGNSHISIRHLKIDGSLATGIFQAIDFYKVDHATVEYVDIIGSNTVRALGVGATNSSNLVIAHNNTSNTAHDQTGEG